MQPKYYGAAAQYNKPAGGPTGLGTILKIFGIFVGAIIIIAVGFSIFATFSKGPQNDFAKLVARMDNLRALLDAKSGNIRSSDLKTINANALLLVSGDASLLTKQLQSSFDLKEVPPDIAASVDDPSIDTTLDNAVLTGTFDKAYVAVLRDAIAKTYDLAQDLQGAGGTATKEAVKKTIESLTAIDEQLSRLQA